MHTEKGALAADPDLSENSHQGFETKNAALCLSFELCNSTTALGIAGTLALASWTVLR